MKQLVVTPVIVAADGPEIIKSDPFDAMVLHLIGRWKINCKTSGEQPGVFTLSNGVGCNGATSKLILSPLGIPRLQISSNVLASEPYNIFSV